jgi:hypothetical protein
LIRRFVFLVIILLLASCAPQLAEPTSEADEAHRTLIDFLTLLNTGKYEEAAPLYGGEYEALQVFNTEIDPADHVALWAWACDNQLLRCLQVRSATFDELRSDTYVFQVEFNNPDGSLFVLGPCCGADETEMPSVAQFEFTVSRNADGKFVVMNTPPYVP